MKHKWIEAISSANKNNFNGCGYVCIDHFPQSKMKKKSDRIELDKDTVPSVFYDFVDIIDIVETSDPREECNCHELANIEKLKSSKIIEKLHTKIKQKDKEIAALKRRIKQVEKQNQLAEQKNMEFEQKLTTCIPLQKCVSISLISNHVHIPDHLLRKIIKRKMIMENLLIEHELNLSRNILEYET